MNLLFDTNVWVAIQRGDQKIRSRWREQDVNSVFLCTPVLAELYQGAMASLKREQNILFVSDLLLEHDCLAFGVQESKRYAELVYAMYAKNQSGKVMDIQIAAIAKVHGLRVITHDIADFRRIPGIDLEDWQI